MGLVEVSVVIVLQTILKMLSSFYYKCYLPRTLSYGDNTKF